MKKVNWDEIKENDGGSFSRPAPGGYVVKIVEAVDVEEKEYIRVEWDFIDGEFTGYNSATYERAGFWPCAIIRSYKPKALPFFKGFKTALEASNKGYVFQEDRIEDMAGKMIGVVLGEEEYTGGNGQVKTRLYVAYTRAVKAIKDGDFMVPELKKLPGNQSAQDTSKDSTGFSEAEEIEEDGELPF